MHKHAAVLSAGFLIAVLTGCGASSPAEMAPDDTGDTGGSGGARASGGAGGKRASGGSGGASDGTGGSVPAAGGAGGSQGPGTGGAPEQGGQGAVTVDAGEGGASGDVDASTPPGDDGGPPSGPPATGQGPVAGGKIVFSQDFEQNMDGTSRSPNGLPADRIQITDDPAKQRGKVVQIKYLAGDNYRTSAGTQPRSWLSSATGYTAKGGTTVSVAFGFMTDNPNWGAHFAQIIRDGGPLWMMLLATDGSVAAEVHRGTGGGKAGVKIEAMKWYDFRIDTTYAGGGAIKFYMDGKLIGQGTGAAGANGRFDCGIYWYNGAKQNRTAWISNISIGEL
jgi:hypothetical protein